MQEPAAPVAAGRRRGDVARQHFLDLVHRARDVRAERLLHRFEERLAGSPIRRIGYESWLRNIAVALGNVYILDAGLVIRSSPIDGIHFDAVEHGKLGKAVAQAVRELRA